MRRKFEKLLDGVMFVSGVIILALATYQVVARSFLHIFLDTNITWTEETMRYLNIATIMLGVYYMTSRGSFATITVFSDFLRAKSKFAGRLLQIFQVAVEAAFYLLVCYYGINLCRQAWHTAAAATRVSMGIVYLFIPVGALMGAINVILKALPIAHQNASEDSSKIN